MLVVASSGIWIYYFFPCPVTKVSRPAGCILRYTTLYHIFPNRLWCDGVQCPSKFVIASVASVKVLQVCAGSVGPGQKMTKYVLEDWEDKRSKVHKPGKRTTVLKLEPFLGVNQLAHPRRNSTSMPASCNAYPCKYIYDSLNEPQTADSSPDAVCLIFSGLALDTLACDSSWLDVSMYSPHTCVRHAYVSVCVRACLRCTCVCVAFLGWSCVLCASHLPCR
jgi:hypothetical protein